MAIDDRCKLFVAGLPDSISEAVLRQLFEATGGTVVEVSVPRDRTTGRPRGFGFVTLSTEEEAHAARDVLDGSMQSGRSISVRPFQAAPPKRPDGGPPGAGGPRSDAPPAYGGGGGGGGGGSGGTEDRTLYLGNLPYETSMQEVEQMLVRAGVESVVRVNLPLDPAGRPRGFGFVTLGSAEAAQAGAVALRDAELKGRRISASIAHARGTNPRGPRPPGGPGGYAGGGGYGGGGYGGPPGGGYSGGGGFGSRPPPRDEPRWDEGGGEPPPLPLPGDEGATGDDRRRKASSGGGGGAGAKDAKKKKASGKSDRKRRDGEGMRAPRARDWEDKDD
jgi:nucleolin